MKTAFILILTATAAVAQDWTLAGTLPDGRTPTAVASLGTDRLFIFTKDSDPDGRSRALVWSPGEGFTPAASAPEAIFNYEAVCITGMPGTNHVYVACGIHFYRYDADADAWSAVRLVSGGITPGAAMTATTSHVYLITGPYDGEGGSFVRRFTPPEVTGGLLGSWADRARLGRSAEPGTRIAWAGGDAIHAIIGNSAEMTSYSIATDTWSTKSRIEAMAENALIAIDSALCADGAGDLYAIPGNGTTNVLRYDGATWTVATAMPSALAYGLAGGPTAIYTLLTGGIWQHVTSTTPPITPSPSPSVPPTEDGGTSTGGGCGGSARATGGVLILGLILIVAKRK